MRFFPRRSSNESRLQVPVSGRDFWTFGEIFSGPKVALRSHGDPREARDAFALFSNVKERPGARGVFER